MHFRYFLRRGTKRMLVALAFLLTSILSFFAWQHYYPVKTSAGWSYRVYLDNFAMVSALALDSRGILYITHEHTHKRGSLIRQLPDGSLSEVMGGLDKPDGLAAFKDGILITQEGGEYPVLWLQGNGRTSALFSGKDIEEVTAYDNQVYAIEDLKVDGRLLRYDHATGKIEVLRTGLLEAEGVAVCPDGKLYYSEKKKGWVRQYDQRASVDPIAHAGLNAPGFLMCNNEGLWITEDATHGARLLLVDAGGVPQVILRRLRSAQTVLSLGPGKLLLAEQGRNRILEINRSSYESK